MGQSSLHTGPTEAPEKRAMWFSWALVLLFLLMVVATVQYFQRHKPSNALTGDSEEATAALSDLLEKTPPTRRVPLLLKDVGDPSPGLRYAAVDALGEEHGPAAAEAIERAFTDSSSVVRQRALEVLPKVDPERGFRMLLSGLRDEDSWIREAAVTQLALVVRQAPATGKRAVPTLIAALDDPDLVVPTLAMRVLQIVTGHPWRIKHQTPPAQRQAIIRHWQQWWAGERAHWNLPTEFANVAPIRPLRGDPAPDFRLRDTEGGAISLSAQHGKVTLLSFWGTWCPPCQQEVPDLVKLDQTYRQQGLDIIGIALGELEGAEGLRRWCRAHGVGYRQALSSEAVQEAYGDIHEVPVSVLIDRKGAIRYRWEGERDFETFRAAVERLLQEAP
ncbi:MAG TPA: redoxin domain-containing protein [Chthonomonadaceae bacterium]|nr:redoxin domain-containing protein [Chthonomonadaceae bacterium]